MSEHVVVNEVTGGKKGQKDCRIDLIPPGPLAEVGLVYGLGSKKYEENNWRRGYEFSLSLAAMHRHINAWHQGESYDSDGFHHLAAVVFHAMALMYNEVHHPELDNVH
jgi:hypothetical protein